MIYRSKNNDRAKNTILHRVMRFFPYKRHRDASSGIVIASLYNIIVMFSIKQDVEAGHNREQQKY